MRKALLLVGLLAIAIPCVAKAYYAGKKEMIQKAEYIALVEITKVEEASKKGKTWTYRQKATATVKCSLKGDLKGDIEIYGMENFICAQCKYETGKYIVFLRKDGEIRVGSNWHLGIRPVKGDKVQWFADDKTRQAMDEKPLDDVLKEIEGVVKEQKKEAADKSAAKSIDRGDR